MQMNSKLLLSLAIPFIALSSFLAKTEYDYRVGSTWEVKVTGVDPRDILKGHYIIYKEHWNFDMSKVLAYAKKHKEFNVRHKKRIIDCLCLSGDKTNPNAYPVRCEDKNKQCETVIKGVLLSTKVPFSVSTNSNQSNYDHDYYWSEKDNIRFNAGIEKFFIDEALAKKLEKELQERSASIEFRVNMSKKAIIKKLKLDGKDWKEVIK